MSYRDDSSSKGKIRVSTSDTSVQIKGETISSNSNSDSTMDSQYYDWEDIIMSGPIGQVALNRKEGIADVDKRIALNNGFKRKTPEGDNLTATQSQDMVDRAWQDFITGESGGPVGKQLGRERKEMLFKKLREKHGESTDDIKRGTPSHSSGHSRGVRTAVIMEADSCSTSSGSTGTIHMSNSSSVSDF
jgi:hypothetical protein